MAEVSPDRSLLPMTRRSAIGLCIATLLLPLHSYAHSVTAPGTPAPSLQPSGKHPEPRPGITAAMVLDPQQVPERHRAAYEAAKAVPEVLDGIYCYCECAEHRGLRSLLSCFETEMPQSCGICKGEARLAYRLSREGKTLDQIRVAVDAGFGD